MESNYKELGTTKLGEEEYKERRIILMKEELAYYYKDMLYKIINNFQSENVRITGKNISGVLILPKKRNHTLYGVEINMMCDFESVRKWTDIE